MLLLLALACGNKDQTADDTGAITGDPANGETLFANCAGCHGATGEGGIDIGGTPSADLTVRVPAMTDAELEGVIADGFGSAMPSQYTDEQDIADVVAYLRQTFP